MQRCGKQGITGRVVNPLRVAASRQAGVELLLISVANLFITVECVLEPHTGFMIVTVLIFFPLYLRCLSCISTHLMLFFYPKFWIL